MKTVIGGTLTVLFEAFGGGHMLELLKIAKQTHAGDSYLTLFRRVTANKGLAGVLDGFLPWGLLQSLTKGAVFGWGQAMSLKLLSNTDMDPSLAMTLSGGMGGFVQGVFMSPLLLLKTRVITNPKFRATSNTWETARLSARVGMEVVAAEGVLALCKGMTVFSVKRFADWTTRYFFVVQVENLLKDDPADKLSSGKAVFAALAGGTLSAFATIPLDVLVATFMQAGKAGKKVSIADTFKEVSAAGGISNVAAFATRG